MALTRGLSGVVLPLLLIWVVPAGAVRPITPAAAEFPQGLVWLNSQDLSLARLRGRRVVVVSFINVFSLNSIRTLSVLNTWWERYALEGLMVIGVHSPDFDKDRDLRLVRAAMKRFGVQFPVVVDNDRAIWSAYQNEGWPAHYLLDSEGQIIHDRLGEGGYQEFEWEILGALRRLNGFEPPDGYSVVADPPSVDCWDATPLRYVGSRRGRPLHLQAPRERNRLVVSSRDGDVTYWGRWTLEPYGLSLSHQNPSLTDFVRLVYHGAEATALIVPPGNRKVRVYLRQDELWLHAKNAGPDVQWDDRDRSFVWVAEPRIYYLTQNADRNVHEVYLYPEEPGTRISSFEFSNGCQVRYDRR